MNALIALLLTALLGGLAGSGTAEKAVAGKLRESFQARSVQVEISRGHRSPFSKTLDRIEVDMAGFRSQGSGEELVFEPGKPLMAGRVGRLQVRASDFEAGGLPVREMRLTMVNLRYDLWKAMLKRRLKLLGFDRQGSTLSVTLTGPGLERFLRPRVTELTDLRLVLEEGRLTVTGKVKVALLPVPIRLSGRLEPMAGAIFLRDPALAVSVVPVPGFVTERIMTQINPLVDLNQGLQSPLRLFLRQISVHPSGLTLQADISAKRSNN